MICAFALLLTAAPDAGPRPIEPVHNVARGSAPADAGAEARATTGGADAGAEARATTGGADAGAEAHATTGGADAGVEQQVPGVVVNARVEPNPVVFGNQFELVITLKRDRGVRLEMPQTFEDVDAAPRAGDPKR